MGNFYTPINGGPALSGGDPFGNQQQVQPSWGNPATTGTPVSGAPPVQLDASGNPFQPPPFDVPAPGGPGTLVTPPQPPQFQGDFDLTQPGFAESMFEKVGQQFGSPLLGEMYTAAAIPGVTAPGAGQDYWDTVGRTLAGNTGQQNLAAQAYQSFQGNRPDIAQDPGLGAYYDNAKRRTLESVGQQAAAAGGYGSSVMQDVGAEAVTNLEAERANREADYNLRRIAEQRAWEGLGGQLAGQAAANQLGWATGLGQLAMGAEEADLARQLGAISAARGMDATTLGRLSGGMNAALAAQGAREGRIGGAFDRTFGMGAAAANAAGGAFADMSESADAMMDAILQAKLGPAYAGLSESDKRRALNNIGLQDVFEFLQGGGFSGLSI